MAKAHSRMPVVFFGHGSPMNTLERNKYTETWRALGEAIPRPKAILCISAHWYTDGAAARRRRARRRQRQRRAQLAAHEAGRRSGFRLGGALQRASARGARFARPSGAQRIRTAGRGRAPRGADPRALSAAALHRRAAERKSVV